MTTTVPLSGGSVVASTSPYGVNASLGSRPDAPQIAHDLGANWARVNTDVNGTTGDVAKYQRWLDADLNLLITMSHRDPASADTSYGTFKEFPHAGFPARDIERYKRDVTALITPLRPALDQGRQIMLQVENEVGDVSNNGAGNVYWRGTTDDFLALERAFYEAVKAVDPRFTVVMASLTSPAVDALVQVTSPNHAYQVSRVGRWLSEGKFDAIDLHFYGCTSQIAAAGAWAAANLPTGTFWISTENAGPTPMCKTTFSAWQTDLNRFESVKAQQVPERMQACAAAGGRVCMWFSLFDLDGEVDTFNHLGLYRSRDSSPTAASEAFRSVASPTSPR